MSRISDNPDFPHAIMHVDGDSFFASCEVARRPDLRGRPVVTGEERGIATAMSKEAKAAGITRGMRVRDIRRNYPQVVILPSDYDMYALYARRMYAIVRRYTDIVDEYSIDECFADLTGCDARLGMPYEEIARAIQADLHESLGVTFSIGLGVNKVTAKMASKMNKPAGFAVMKHGHILEHLAAVPVGKVWGIGSETTHFLRKLGVATALDLAQKDRAWVAQHCARPLAEIYEEFHGHFVKEFSGGGAFGHGSDYASVQRTRTFHPATCDRAFVWSQLSHHVEDASMRLRAHGRLATRAFVFIKTQDFQYLRCEVPLSQGLSAPQDILREIKPHYEKLFRDGLWYRAAGVGLSGLQEKEGGTLQLFAAPPQADRSDIIHAAIDKLANRFGRHTVFLGSSMKALSREREARVRPKFELIFLGEVR